MDHESLEVVVTRETPGGGKGKTRSKAQICCFSDISPHIVPDFHTSVPLLWVPEQLPSSTDSSLHSV